MSLSPNETELIGSWIVTNGRTVDDATGQRIRNLIETELDCVAVSGDGWRKLYQDRTDGRYWELYHPRSWMHGGGPQALRVLDPKSAKESYGVSVKG